MPLPPKRNHLIPLLEASILTANYRNNSPLGSKKGGMFWKEAIEKIVDQRGCVALRFYYARNEDGTPTLVLVGVDEQGHDMVTGILAEYAWPCPPVCDLANPLNSSPEYIASVMSESAAAV